MSFLDLYSNLKEHFSTVDPMIDVNGLDVKVTNHPFTSDTSNTFPEGDEYSEINPLVKALMKYYLSQNEFSDRYLMKRLNAPDSTVEENNSFTFSMMSDEKAAESGTAILLLHGLNERGWEKYLPWAHRLVKLTGQPVILFPHAFHMHRAPKCWSDFRLMKEISNERKVLLPGVEMSSPINVAISSRLQFVPQRFVYSGLQTIYDITKLAQMAQEGEIEGLKPGTKLNIFGYSIGAFIAQIVMMSNPLGLFNSSKCVLFCGGTTLDRMEPINKYILDSEAAEALKDFYVHRLDQNLATDDRLRALFSPDAGETFLFKSMLSHEAGLVARKRHLAKIRDRIYGIALDKDLVMPPWAIKECLVSDHPKKIAFDTVVLDYDYTHENPFPTLTKIREKVDAGFDTVFEKAGSFLG